MRVSHRASRAITTWPWAQPPPRAAYCMRDRRPRPRPACLGLLPPPLHTQANASPSHWYLKPDNVPEEYNPTQPVVVGVTQFITAFILYSESLWGGASRRGGGSSARGPAVGCRWLSPAYKQAACTGSGQ
jgi:hypothetical protein